VSRGNGGGCTASQRTWSAHGREEQELGDAKHILAVRSSSLLRIHDRRARAVKRAWSDDTTRQISDVGDVKVRACSWMVATASTEVGQPVRKNVISFTSPRATNVWCDVCVWGGNQKAVK